MIAHPSQEDLGVLIGVALRKYQREPETRASAARLLLVAALRLYARETSAEEAKRTAQQVIAQIPQAGK